MAKCVICGKTGLFLNLDNNKMCVDCAVLKADKSLSLYGLKSFTKSVSLRYDAGNRAGGGWHYIELRIDDATKKFAISAQKVLSNCPYIAYRVFDYSKLKSVQIEEDGTTIISGNAGSVLAGGLIAGGLGAMMGAAGSRTVGSIITSVDMVLLLDDIDFPKIKIPIIKKITERKTSYYKKRMKDVEPLYDLLTYVMGQTPAEAGQKQQSFETPYTEVLKLKELLDMGIITQEEFNLKKKQLLKL